MVPTTSTHASGRCQICRTDPDILVVLPQARGNTVTFGCIDCAIRLGLYRTKHDGPHTAFDDGLSACIRCIEKLSAKDEEVCEELLRRVRKEIAADEREELDDWLAVTTELTGNTEARCFMRALAGKALRLGVPVEAIEARIARERSINLIL